MANNHGPRDESQGENPKHRNRFEPPSSRSSTGRPYSDSSSENSGTRGRKFDRRYPDSSGEGSPSRPASSARAASSSAANRRTEGAGGKHGYTPQSSRNKKPSHRAASSRVIQSPPSATSKVKQQGGKGVQALLLVVALICLILPAFGYKAIGTLGQDLASAGNLKLGDGSHKDGATDILLVGADSRTDAKGNPLTPDEVKMLHAGDEQGTLNTDTIILIRVPNDGSSATAISIPRDSYIHTDQLGNTKINGVFGQTKYLKQEELTKEGDTDTADVEKKSTEAGRQALITAVANLTGITVDHYAEVGLLGFVLLTNAVGGVQVCLKDNVNDEYSGADFKAGVQTLNGSQALAFVRQRHGLPRGDLDRIARQQAYMASLAHKVLSTGTLTNTSTLSKLSDAVQRSVVLDSDWDIMGFATQMQNMAGGHVTFQTIPVTSIDGTGDNGESVVTVNPEQVHQFVAQTIGKKADNTTTSSQAPTTSQVAKDFDASGYTVSVMNASSTSGLATRVSQVVAHEGYTSGEIGNDSTSSATSSAVLTADTNSDAAKYLAQKLGIPVKKDSSLSKGTMQVLLASDYSGPGATESSLESYLNGSEPSSSNGSSNSSSNSPGEVGQMTSEGEKSPTFTAGDGPKCVN